MLLQLDSSSYKTLTYEIQKKRTVMSKNYTFEEELNYQIMQYLPYPARLIVK